jgi:hypothetical protein
MNWEAIGAIGEIVGAVAVIATLAYLSIQIRQSKVSSTSANVQSAIASFNPLNMAVGADPELASLVNRGISDFDSLNEKERSQYSYVQRAYLNCFWNVFLQHKLGAMSEDMWLMFAHEVAFLLARPGPQVFRQSNRMYDKMFESVEAMHLEIDHLDLDLDVTNLGSHRT